MQIPFKWREFGINLNIPEPRLMAIPADITLGGNNQQFFSQVFAIWQSTETVRTWRVILDALVSEGVNERPLAEEVVSKLKAKAGIQQGTFFLTIYIHLICSHSVLPCLGMFDYILLKS